MKKFKNFTYRIIEWSRLYHNWLLVGALISTVGTISALLMDLLGKGSMDTALIWLIVTLLTTREYRDAVYDYTVEQEYRQEGF